MTQREGGSRIQSGMTPSLGPLPQREMGKKPPRWPIAFLRSIERTGEVQAAAEDAGVDKSTAYARRRAHPDFAEAWAEALKRHRAERKKAEKEAIAALNKAHPPHMVRSPSPANAGEDVVANGRVKRVSAERWGKRKEKIFFDELAATNNIRRSAAAAGVSYNAVHARRLRDPLFAAKWDAVARSARAAIDMHLIQEAQKRFDPETLDLPDGPPQVTIDQAIKISQIGAARDKGARDPFADPTANMGEEEDEELRERLIRKLLALRRREHAELLTQGWTYDEQHDCIVPPGWVKRAD